MKLHQHGGNINYYATRLGIPKYQLLDFSANINPLGYPPGLEAALMGDLSSILNYPDPDYTELKTIIAKYFVSSTKNIILGNGAIEIIYLIFHSLRPKKIIIPIPTFSEYHRAAEACNVSVETALLEENQDWDLPVDAIVKQLPGADMLFICNPNNPTGNKFSLDKLLYLSKKCAEANVLLIVDESFLLFTEAENGASLSNYVNDNDKILVISSLTKILGIPGLRFGFALGNENLINQIRKYQGPWPVNSMAEIAVKIGLNNHDYINESKAYIIKEKEFMYKELSQIRGIEPFYPQANFILCKIINPQITAKSLLKEASFKGILIRDCSNFSGLSEKYFRVAVKQHDDNCQLIATLKKILTKE
ncbi:MAG: threonine-phosphate decarboxylase CobD [Bacillota bacterium]|nr:threonine-phosphate decarboxylase CobD [Bacillota bacterium]